MIDYNNEGMVPEQDFRTAVDVCCRDPRLAGIYRSAPPGAKRFLELQFYVRVFAAQLDDARYNACLQGVVSGLTAVDIDYLLLGETDLATRAYLQDLRARLAPAEAVAASVPAAGEAPRRMALKRVADVQRERMQAEEDAAGESVADSAEGRGGGRLLLGLVGAVVLLAFAAAGWWLLYGRDARDAARRRDSEVQALFEERIRAVEMRIAELEQEKKDLPGLQAAEIKAATEEHEVRMAPMKKAQEELTAAIEQRAKQVEALVAQSGKLTRDAESMIAQLTARIAAVGGADGSAKRGASANKAGAIVDRACTKCKGAGQIVDSTTCPTCHGDGRAARVRYYDDRYGYYRFRYQNEGNCANCRGSGRVKVKNPCFQCDGKGRIPLDR